MTRWEPCDFDASALRFGSNEDEQPIFVHFHPRASDGWIGSFAPGRRGITGVFEHPDRVHVVVVSLGEAYVVDAEERACVDRLGSTVDAALEIPSRRVLVLSDGERLDFLEPERTRTTRRLSWDGVRNLDVYGNEIHGEAWNPAEGAWHAFRVDLETLAVTGGSYSGKD